MFDNDLAVGFRYGELENGLPESKLLDRKKRVSERRLEQDGLSPVCVTDKGCGYPAPFLFSVVFTFLSH